MRPFQLIIHWFSSNMYIDLLAFRYIETNIICIIGDFQTTTGNNEWSLLVKIQFLLVNPFFLRKLTSLNWSWDRWGNDCNSIKRWILQMHSISNPNLFSKHIFQLGRFFKTNSNSNACHYVFFLSFSPSVSLQQYKKSGQINW